MYILKTKPTFSTILIKCPTLYKFYANSSNPFQKSIDNIKGILAEYTALLSELEELPVPKSVTSLKRGQEVYFSIYSGCTQTVNSFKDGLLTIKPLYKTDTITTYSLLDPETGTWGFERKDGTWCEFKIFTNKEDWRKYSLINRASGIQSLDLEGSVQMLKTVLAELK